MAEKTINPEVVNDMPRTAKPVGMGTVAWDSAATFKSPFFWFVLGAVGVLVYFEVVRSRERKAAKPKVF